MTEHVKGTRPDFGEPEPARVLGSPDIDGPMQANVRRGNVTLHIKVIKTVVGAAIPAPAPAAEPELPPQPPPLSPEELAADAAFIADANSAAEPTAAEPGADL